MPIERILIAGRLKKKQKNREKKRNEKKKEERKRERKKKKEENNKFFYLFLSQVFYFKYSKSVINSLIGVLSKVHKIHVTPYMALRDTCQPSTSALE